jgi:hypothetical protein
MGKNAKDALGVVKPIFEKLPKDVPPYLSADWKEFVKQAKTVVDELGKVVESADIVKARTDYDKAKTLLASLKKKINDAVDSETTALSNARNAVGEMNKAGNKINAVVKDKQNEPKSAALGKAVSALAPIAQREAQSVDSPQKVD